MKKLLLCALIFFVSGNLFSQSIMDSLANNLNRATSDTGKMILMFKMAGNCIRYDKSRANEYFNKAKALLEKVPFKKGEAHYYYVKALMKDNEPSEAIENLNKSLKLFNELYDKSGSALVMLSLGRIYNYQSKEDKAMTQFLTALKNFQSLNDNNNIGICYSNIANIYVSQNKFKIALEYQKRALVFLKDKTRPYLQTYLNIPIEYGALGEYKTASLYFDSVVNKLKQTSYTDLLSNVYANMGVMHDRLKDYNKSKHFFKLSYDIAAKANDINSLVATCMNMAAIFIALNQPDSAIILLEKNLPVIIQLKSKSFLTDYYEYLSTAYEIKGDIGSAYKNFKLFKTASDSLNHEQAKQRLYELQTSFEVSRKDEQIETLNKENLYKTAQLSKQRIIIMLVLLSTLLSIIVALILYNRFRLKRKLAIILENKNNEIEQQQQEILAMNDMLGKQNEDLQEMDNVKSRFFTNISHEFRTPLSLIIGPLDAMKDKAKDPATKNEFNFMLKHANSLLNLINQLLDLSKLQMAGLQLQLSNSDINKFLSTLIDSFSCRAAELEVRLNYVSNLPCNVLWFDKDKIGKIMVNLLSNALKHTPREGFVEVLLNAIPEKPDYIEIIVRDNGIGIERHEIKNIFEPFYQSEATINRKIEGSGIGLALVKELVELHGGAISVSSETGKGAEFKVCIAVNKDRLPLAEISDDKKGVASFCFSAEILSDNTTNVRNKAIKDKTTILVVEDNDDMRGYITKNLCKEYQIIEAINGKQGYDKAKELSPDLIIADVMMPVIDGYEMTRLIKNDSLTSHIPVIMLTAKASEESKIEGLESAADDYISKPFNMKELLLRINNAITNRQRLRDKFRKSITVNPSEVTATSLDEQFLTKALQIIENHLTESEFSVDDFCTAIGISKTHVYRKLKALTNQSFTEFLRTIRLKRAASLLSIKTGNLTEIAYQTGFTNLSYFSRSFKEQFGVNPSEYSQSFSRELKS
jgi:signal transduction histidine kinase/DNA-binding response OmpR family regulator